jgi:hypothetical protein
MILDRQSIIRQQHQRNYENTAIQLSKQTEIMSVRLDSSDGSLKSVDARLADLQSEVASISRNADALPDMVSFMEKIVRIVVLPFKPFCNT